MKKKLLSLMLVVSLVASILVPAGAVSVTNENGTYDMALIGTLTTEETKLVDGSDGIILEWQVQGSSIKNAMSIAFAIDSNKLELVSQNERATRNGGDTTIISNTFSKAAYYGSSTNNTKVCGSGDTDVFSVDCQVFIPTDAQVAAANGRKIVKIEFNDTGVYNATDGLTAVATLGLKFKTDPATGKAYTLDDLDPSSITLATAADVSYYNMASIALIQVQTDEATSATANYMYGEKGASIEASTLGKPDIILDGKDISTFKSNLNAVTATVVSKEDPTKTVTAINVPEMYDEDGKLSTDSITAVNVVSKAYKAADYTDTDEFTAEEYKDVKWSYEIGVKPEDGVSEDDDAYKALVADVNRTVTFDETTGDITIAAGAPVCTLQISVTGQWDSDSAGNPARKVTSKAAELQLCHGTADSIEGSNNPGPADGAIELRGVKIVDGDGSQLAISSDTEASQVYATNDASDSLALNAVEFDQYGDAMKTTVGSWGDNKPGENGAIDLTALTAEDSPYEYSYTAVGTKTYTATVSLNITEYKITWGELKSGSLTYGEQPEITGDEIVLKKDGSALDEGTTSEFTWKDSTLPEVGTTKVTRQCKVGDAVVATKDYYITVAKADQNIKIDGDPAKGDPIADFVLNLDEETDLKTTVTNAKVDALIADGDATLQAVETGTTVTYSISPESNTLTVADGVMKGTLLDEEATLTITAAGNDNYNAAIRTLAVSVKRLLRATVEFTSDNDDGAVYDATITATVTEDENQSGSLNGCDFEWGYIDDSDEFVALTATTENGRENVSGISQTKISRTAWRL
jgi:hypothetical protein